jgi:hypothetical protein
MEPAEKSIGIPSLGLAVVLFVLAAALVPVLACAIGIGWFWAAAASGVALVAWPLLGWLTYLAFRPCYQAAFGNSFEDVASAKQEVIEDRRVVRSLCLVVWPLFVCAICPILLLAWIIRKMFRN